MTDGRPGEWRVCLLARALKLDVLAAKLFLSGPVSIFMPRSVSTLIPRWVSRVIRPSVVAKCDSSA